MFVTFNTSQPIVIIFFNDHLVDQRNFIANNPSPRTLGLCSTGLKSHHDIHYGGTICYDFN